MFRRVNSESAEQLKEWNRNFQTYSSKKGGNANEAFFILVKLGG